MLDEDAGLNWYDYGFRNYDPQTGRFMQLDPLTDEYPALTPFQYAINDPITNIDVDGLAGCPSVAGLVGYGAGAGLSAGSSIFQGIEVSARIATMTSIGLNILRAGDVAVIVNSQKALIKQQMANNSINSPFDTKQAGAPIPHGPRHGYLSADAAALGWGFTYGNSINQMIEFSSIIYSRQEGNQTLYYFTTALHFRKNEDAWHSSPSLQQWIQNNYYKLIPKDATIVGQIHSHPWSGIHNYTFSDNNEAGLVKERSDEDIMAQSNNAGFVHYLYNALGRILARRPDSDFNSNGQDELIGVGFPWDPRALVEDKNKALVPIGVYPTPGHPKRGPYFRGKEDKPVR